MADLVESMKRAALDAVAATSPCRVICGKVISTDPLQIRVDQKIILGTNQLLLSATVAGNLSTDDQVIMIRQAGGQEYYVMDWRG